MANPYGACEAKVIVGYGHTGPISVVCGKYWAGQKKLCANCTRQAEEDFPQGWKGYPGDICRHGVYTGGCGADYMCGQCEMGED